MMRITTFGMSNQYMYDINSVQERMNLSEQQLTTGRKINQPSDDPVGTVLDMQIRTTTSNLDQWTQNATDAQTWFANSESALSDVQSNLQKARTLIVQANNTTVTPDDRTDLASNIDQIREGLEQIANTKVGDQYIFGGTNTTVAPLTVGTDALGNPTYTWNGNTNNRNYQLGISTQITVNTNGENVFYNAPTGAPQGLLATLSQASQDLKDPNVTNATLSSDLGNIDAQLKNVTAVMADLGAKQNRVTALQNQFSQMQTALKGQLSNVEDANMADVISKFSAQQTVYQAALDTAQKMLLPTLADYLK